MEGQEACSDGGGGAGIGIGPILAWYKGTWRELRAKKEARTRCAGMRYGSTGPRSLLELGSWMIRMGGEKSEQAPPTTTDLDAGLTKHGNRCSSSASSSQSAARPQPCLPDS